VTAAPLAMSGIAGGPDKAAEAPAKQAAKQLEAFFLRQFLAEARPDSSGVMGGGFAGDTFKDMLDSALADSMAAAGGLGMAGGFESQLGAPVAPVPLSPTLTPQMPATAADFATPSHDVSAAGYIHPTVGRFSSRFGARIDPINHTQSVHPGLDFAAREGTPVVAAAAGTVERAGSAGTYGNLVVLRHPDGSETRYAHLSAISVHKGDQVAAGAPLGAVGTTGRSTGPHLHFEVRRDGRPVDPWPLLEGEKVGGTP
jgi:murein DD-endopeptidase MepM/ murein hydrolase activator NlpD